MLPEIGDSRSLSLNANALPDDRFACALTRGLAMPWLGSRPKLQGLVCVNRKGDLMETLGCDSNQRGSAGSCIVGGLELSLRKGVSQTPKSRPQCRFLVVGRAVDIR